MPKVPLQAVMEALRSFWAEKAAPTDASFVETFMTAKWLAQEGITPTISDTDDAVRTLFVIFPHEQYGRLQPFRAQADGSNQVPTWGQVAQSGRKTVWNVGTRTRGKVLFVQEHMQNGLKPNAADVLASSVSKRFDPVALACYFLRESEVPSLRGEELVAAFQAAFGLSQQELEAIADLSRSNWRTRVVAAGPEWNPSLLPAEWKPPRHSGGEVAAPEPSKKHLPAHSLEDSVKVVVDERVMRMLRTALSAYSAVVAVGPPGTGKTTIVQQLIAEAAANPQSFGFQLPVNSPIVVTPDESWTTRELVGGETIVNGQLEFVEGHVLQAIRLSQWLVLDEINRADMDRIFGGLFTWLSGKPVTVGRVGPGSEAATIVLGWSGKPDSEVLSDAVTKSYLAGDEWRLLATYNAVDAAKVFRFGQALARRFVRVPIPTLTPGEFRDIAAKVASGLPELILTWLVNVYEAHHRVEPLGPALFLRIPEYVRAAETDLNTPTEPAWLRQIFAEAYLLNVGGWLAKLDDDQLKEIERTLVGAELTFAEGEWTWIIEMAKNLG